MTGVLQRLAERCGDDPRRPAIVHAQASGDHRTRSVGWLVARGLQYRDAFAAPAWAGAPVLMFAARSPELVAMMVGCALAGRPFASLNIRLKPDQVTAIASAAGAGRIATDRAGARLFQRRSPDGTAVELWCGEVELPGEVAQDLPHLAQDLRVAAMAIDARAPACCLFTSGSTGTPKGVLISGEDLTRRAAVEVECYGLTDADRVLNVLPFSFDVGLNQLLTTLLSGAVLVIMDSWLPRDLLDVVESQQVTGISGVPAVWRDLRASGLAVDTAGRHRSLRYITVSGGSLTVPELQALRTLMPGVGIFKTYGQTETFRSSLLRPEELDSHRASVGRPYPGTFVRIVDEDGRLCRTGQVGEIVHSGLGVMLGYLDGSDQGGKRRANGFRAGQADSEHAIWTGDLGYLDEDGFLYLEGRRDGMLKVSGNRFYPEEITSLVIAMPGVRDVEVIGVDPKAVETRVAMFLVADGGDAAAAPIVDALRQRVPGYMVPSVVRVLSAMPRLANGKPDRVRLRELAIGT